jgi:hypothetical protein
MPTVVLSPVNVADFPEGGGHFWVYMQYALGLASAGCEVFWLERFRGSDSPERDEAALHLFRARMERFGLSGRVLLYPGRGKRTDVCVPERYIGVSRAEAEAVFDRADLLLNFHYTIAPELLARFRRTALVDIDPGLLQFWMSRGQLRVPPHDLYLTTGETVGTAGARIPDCGLEWIHIRPPVSLAQWPPAPDGGRGTFTTVSNWSSKDWIVDGDETYENTKRAAFLEFADLPRRTGQPLELALFLRTEDDASDRRDLVDRGWRVRHAREVAATPERYRSYIQKSRAEFSCAKRSCTMFQNAWISDRTLCYLASGRPAVVQDTGPIPFLPEGEGLLRFSTLDEAVAAIEAVNEDYERHSRAARGIVESFFDADRVAERILGCALP